jgi:hypothetical protein
LLWPFPVYCGSGKPLGDGIYWATKGSKEEEIGLNSSIKKGSVTDGSPDRKSGASPFKF